MPPFSLSVSHELPGPNPQDLPTVLQDNGSQPIPANYSAYISYTTCCTCIKTDKTPKAAQDRYNQYFDQSVLSFQRSIKRLYLCGWTTYKKICSRMSCEQATIGAPAEIYWPISSHQPNVTHDYNWPRRNIECNLNQPSNAGSRLKNAAPVEQSTTKAQGDTSMPKKTRNKTYRETRHSLPT